MNPLFKRVIAAIGANAFGQAITIIIQLFSLPLFLYKWSLSTYGSWLIISAIPSYFAMADIGMASVAGNRMTMAIERGENERANKIFHSIILFIGLISLLIVGLLGCFLFIFDFQVLNEPGYRVTLIILTLTVLVSLYNGVADAIFRATNRFALGIFSNNLLRLMEWIGGLIGLLVSPTFMAVALGAFLVRVVGLIIIIFISNNNTFGIRWGIGGGDVRELKKIIKPALFYMLFPLSNAMSFQGVTLIVGYIFGAAIVGVFNTYRTLARVAVQMAGIFGHSLWVEFSKLYAQKHFLLLKKIYLKSTVLGAVITILMCAFLYFASPFIMRIWTHGQIRFDINLMVVMILYAMVGGIWHVPRILLLATNKHIGISYCCLLSSVFVLVMVLVFSKWWGLNGVAIGMFIAELFMLLFAILLSRNLLNAKIKQVEINPIYGLS